MVSHIYTPKVLFMMDEEDKEFREIRDHLADDGVSVFLAKTPEEGIDNLSVINIDALIYQGDFAKQTDVLNFLKTHSKKFPVILVGQRGKNEVPSEWLNISDIYLDINSAKRELAKTCFELIENKKDHRKAA
ncbi:MAG: hypothetical protein DRQ88_02495 [Epsilonproteobacteria bacterium]|nr:MAG: hypothetical protein DRQ89_02360 [Campylobacterota bacterium]RLA67537.1 MAG: hypothetical protein DRQ88_02495 [Campylobacterota bacterium]